MPRIFKSHRGQALSRLAAIILMTFGAFVSASARRFPVLAPPAPGQVIISEFRLRGPDNISPIPNPIIQSHNEFVEIYNNTDSDIVVSTSDGSSGWAIVASNGATMLVIPNNTTIRARGHYLAINANEYSLGDYGGPGAAQGDDGWLMGPDLVGESIPDAGGVALFRTSNPANFTLSERLDAAGYTSAPALYREGAGLPTGGPEFTNNVEFSFFRQFVGGLPKDTGDNVADFLGASTDGSGTGLGPRLGAPGPENLSSPIQRNSQIGYTLIDPLTSSASPPNRVRVQRAGCATCDNTTSNLGTLEFRRTLTNNTGQTITRLRFRVTDISTYPAPDAATADLRVLSVADTTVTVNGVPVPVKGTTLEEPPAQPIGGGWNSSLTLTAPVSIPAGGSINLRFRTGVQQSGNFRYFINFELLP